eukprot:155228_1
MYSQCKLWMYSETVAKAHEYGRARLPEQMPNETSNDNVFQRMVRSDSQILIFQMNGDHPYINDKTYDAGNTTFCKQYTDVIFANECNHSTILDKYHSQIV